MHPTLKLPSKPNAVIIHPVSFVRGVETKLNKKMFHEVPETLKSVNSVWNQPVKASAHGCYITTPYKDTLILSLFCITSLGVLNEVVFRQLLRRIRAEYHGQEVYLPVKLGFDHMEPEEWQDVMGLASSDLEALVPASESMTGIRFLSTKPCHVNIWKY